MMPAPILIYTLSKKGMDLDKEDLNIPVAIAILIGLIVFMIIQWLK